MASAYYQSRYTPKIYESEISPELIAKVGKYKTQMYEQNLAKIKSMQTSAINIDFMRDDAKQTLQSYNDEIKANLNNSQFQYQDLSDATIANKYIHVFDKLSQDKDLMRAYRIENNYRNEISKITADRGKKDSQFGETNFIVWQNEEGGIKDYLSANSYKGWNKQMPTYTPYYDVSKEFAKLGSDLKNLTRTTQAKEVEYRVGPDGKVRAYNNYNLITTDFRDPEKVKNWFEMKTSSAAKTQMSIDAKAKIYASGQNAEQIATSIYGVRKDAYDYQVKTFDNALKEHDAKIKVLKASKVEADTEQKIQELEASKEEIAAKQKTFLSKKQETLDDLKKYDIHQLANEWSQIYVDNRITEAARAVSGIISQKYSLNSGAVAMDKLNWDKQKFDMMMKMKERELDLKEAKIKAESGGGGTSGGGVGETNLIGESVPTISNVSTTGEGINQAKSTYGYAKAILEQLKNGTYKNTFENLKKSIKENQDTQINPYAGIFSELETLLNDGTKDINVANNGTADDRTKFEAIKKYLADNDEWNDIYYQLETKYNMYTHLSYDLYNKAVDALDKSTDPKDIQINKNKNSDDYKNRIWSIYKDMADVWEANAYVTKYKTSAYTTGKTEAAGKNMDAQIKTAITRKLGTQIAEYVDLSETYLNNGPAGQYIEFALKLDNSSGKLVKQLTPKDGEDKIITVNQEAFSPFVIEQSPDGRTIMLREDSNARLPKWIDKVSALDSDKTANDETKEKWNKLPKSIKDKFGNSVDAYGNYLNEGHVETEADFPDQPLKVAWVDIAATNKRIKIGGAKELGLGMDFTDWETNKALELTSITNVPITVTQHKGYVVKAIKDKNKSEVDLYIYNSIGQNVKKFTVAQLNFEKLRSYSKSVVDQHLSSK